MKKFILLLLINVWCTQIFGQKYYSDKKEYESALNYYYDAKDSYENYLKKISYFKNFKYPKNKSYPKNVDGWYQLWETDFNILNIRPDNNDIRLHSNIIPEDTLYINFIEIPDSIYLVIKMTNKRIPKNEYKFCARTLKFKHPGTMPLFVKKIEHVPISNEFTTNKKENIKITKKENFYSIEDQIKLFYFMPDGKKYTYENLIKSYPSMSDNKVFLYYFKN